MDEWKVYGIKLCLIIRKCGAYLNAHTFIPVLKIALSSNNGKWKKYKSLEVFSTLL